jgi:hypothetical protein
MNGSAVQTRVCPPGVFFTSAEEDVHVLEVRLISGVHPVSSPVGELPRLCTCFYSLHYGSVGADGSWLCFVVKCRRAEHEPDVAQPDIPLTCRTPPVLAARVDAPTQPY